MSSFDRAGTAELAPHGLTVSQLNILTVLHRADRTLSMGELCQPISVRPDNVTDVVDGLVSKSCGERQINPGDRRSFLVANSEAGQRFRSEFLPSHWCDVGALAW